MKIEVGSAMKSLKSISKKFKEDEERRENSKSFGPRLDMTFIGSVIGKYEMKVFLDKNSQYGLPITLHTVKTKFHDKDSVTVVCSGEDCPICKKNAKLRELGFENLWKKSSTYSLYKFFMKTGKIVDEASTLKPDSVYVAYANKGYFQSLTEAINSAYDYSEDEISEMLDPESTSHGFVVTAVQGTPPKGNTFNFNFVTNDKVKIQAVNISEEFGSDDEPGSVDVVDLETAGYFRSDYIDEEKVKACTKYLDNLIVYVAEHGGSEDEDEEDTSEYDDTDDTEEVEEVEESEDNEEVEEIDDSEEDSEDSEESEDNDDAEEESEKSEGSDDEDLDAELKALQDEDSDEEPECFGSFDKHSKKCIKECPFNKACIRKTAKEGKY